MPSFDPLTAPAAPSPTLAERLQQARALIDAAVADSTSRVKAGGDNPAIVRGIGGNGSRLSFTMSSSALSGGVPWTPFFHDWKAQYERVAELIEARQFASVADILEKGQFRDRNRHHAERFAPEVVAHLQTALGDLRGAGQLFAQDAQGPGEPAPSDAAPQKKTRRARP